MILQSQEQNATNQRWKQNLQATTIQGYPLLGNKN